MKKIIVAAVTLNNIIGKDETLPWKNSEELNHFKNATLESAVLMGRVTYESLKKPLPDRLNLVISNSAKENKPSENLYYFLSIIDAIKFAKKRDYHYLFIAGGSEIYSQMINEVDELLISRMPFEIEGNKHFPKISTSIWEQKEVTEFNSFSVERYLKRF